MRFISQVGTAVLALALGLAPATIGLALPLIDTGIFGQVEPVAVGLHVVSALAALGLMLVSVGAPAALAGAVPAPILALAAVALVGAATAPFAGDPLRSVHGGLDHGVGVLWFAEVALLAMAGLVLRRERPRAFEAAALAGAAVTAACIFLQVASPPYGKATFAPYTFPGYLGPNALLAAVPLLASGRRGFAVAGVVLAAAGLAASGNRGAALAAPAALAVWFVASRLRPGQRHRALALAGPGLSLALLTLILGAAPAIQAWGVSRVPASDAATAPLSAKPIDRVAIQLTPLGTVWQRSVSARLVASSLAAQPTDLLTGRGYGSFEAVTVERSGEVPGRRFADENPTASRLYWDGDNKAKFHVHNLLLDAVLSGGLAAAVAWLAFLWALGRTAAPAAVAGAATLVAALAVAGSFWFLVNAAGPLLAVAVASILPSARVRPAKAPPALALATPAFAVLMVGFSAAGAMAYSAASGEREERYFPALMAGPGGPPCTGFHADLMPNRQANVSLYRVFVQRIVAKGDMGFVELVPRVTNLANYSCLMRTYAAAGDLEALELSLRARSILNGVLGHDNPILTKAIAPDFNLWIDDIERMLDRAPSRTDVLIPFLTWTSKANRPDRLVAAARLLPRLREDDPIRHHYLSLRAAAENRPEEAREERRKALSLGLANLMPVKVEQTAGAEAR